MTGAFVTWLTTAALGPAVVALPVNLAADKLATAAVAWFKRVRQTDDFSRLVKSAADDSVDLSRDEIKALRDLLGKEDTWRLLATTDQLKVAELTSQIAACLPARDGRTAAGALAAAGVIARGLMEFAVSSLTPEVFQQVVLARLGQMISEVTALDQALLGMHKDRYHDVKEAGGLFQILMDRLPPAPADANEVRIYLNELISLLKTDRWPTRQGLGGPKLTPASIERKLRIHSSGMKQEQDADELAGRCTRLVILGGPGSGKTWLAKRIARICAERALAELDEGAALADVELPLHTTCARLIGAPGGIRHAASAAVERIGDLGGERIVTSLRLRFEAPGTRTLLVIDSLDEAADPGEASDRLREVETLPSQTWRIVLTSRRASWDSQLTIEDKNPAHQLGELQPLRYPGDVREVIERWFADQPGRGRALAAQIDGRPSLQRDATVPLILAFYCILSGPPSPEAQPLPEFKHDLYERVIESMLRGSWRASGRPPPDRDACLAALRTWAWQGVEDDPVSSIGRWNDDIPTTYVQLSPAGQVAVDHIAPPDSGQTMRRFVHRTIHEHLVAEHVAGLPVDEAVKEVLPHLWYDPDWEYAAPAAIAMHDERDQVLRLLLCRAQMSDELPDRLSVIDGGFEVRKLLARVAAESREDEWPPDLAAIIGQARVDLVLHPDAGRDLGEADHWPASDEDAREALRPLLTIAGPSWMAESLAGEMARLGPTRADQDQARTTLMGLLDGHGATDELVGALIRLNPPLEDRTRMCDILLGQLAVPFAPPWLADALAQLAQTAEEKHRVRNALLRSLTGNIDGVDAEQLVAALVQLDPTPDDAHDALKAVLALLDDRGTPTTTRYIAAIIVQLNQIAEVKSLARSKVLKLLDGQITDAHAARLAAFVAELDPAPGDKRQALATVRGLLARHVTGSVAAELAATVAQLHPGPGDQGQAREAILDLLADPAERWNADTLARLLIQLEPTAEDMRRALKDVIDLLDAPSPEDQRRLVHTPAIDQVIQADVMDRMMFRLVSEYMDPLAARLAALVLQLDPEPCDKRRALNALLALLDGQATGVGADRLTAIVVRLDPTPGDKRRANDAVLRLLAAAANGWVADLLASALVQLDAAPEDRSQACDALLGQLNGQVPPDVAEAIAAGLTLLGPTADHMRQARGKLLGQIYRRPALNAGSYLLAVLQLAPAPEDKREVRDALRRLMDHVTDSRVATELADYLAKFDPTVHDLSSLHNWAAVQTGKLCAAVRRNSTLEEWLAVLPLVEP